MSVRNNWLFQAQLPGFEALAKIEPIQAECPKTSSVAGAPSFLHRDSLTLSSPAPSRISLKQKNNIQAFQRNNQQDLHARIRNLKLLLLLAPSEVHFESQHGTPAITMKRATERGDKRENQAFGPPLSVQTQLHCSTANPAELKEKGRLFNPKATSKLF